MGFWSSVGSFFSGCCRAVSSVCRAVVDTAVSVVKGVGTFVSEVGKLALEPFKSVIGMVVRTCIKLGLINPKEKPEELGDKVLQAQEAGITPESCKNYKEYAEKINNFKVDPEKSKQYSEIDKLMAAGVYCEGALIHKFGFGIGKMVPIIVKNPSFQNPDKLAAMFVACEKNNSSMDKMADYLSGNLKGKEREEVGKIYNNL
jgi:hypothetical protein